MEPACHQPKLAPVCRRCCRSCSHSRRLPLHPRRPCPPMAAARTATPGPAGLPCLQACPSPVLQENRLGVHRCLQNAHCQCQYMLIRAFIGVLARLDPIDTWDLIP